MNLKPLSLFLLVVVMAISCSNSDKKKEKKGSYSPELIGNFSYTENGTPAFKIIDTLINNKKEKFLKFYDFKTKKGYVLDKKKYKNLTEYQKIFKPEYDWIYEMVDFLNDDLSNSDRITFLSTSKEVNFKNKILENHYNQLKNYGVIKDAKFNKSYKNGFFVWITKGGGISLSRIYRTNKKFDNRKLSYDQKKQKKLEIELEKRREKIKTL